MISGRKSPPISLLGNSINFLLTLTRRLLARLYLLLSQTKCIHLKVQNSFPNAGNPCAPLKRLYYVGEQDPPWVSSQEHPGSNLLGERDSSVCARAQSVCPERPMGEETKSSRSRRSSRPALGGPSPACCGGGTSLYLGPTRPMEQGSQSSLFQGQRLEQ